jgi:hypothetical protein
MPASETPQRGFLMPVLRTVPDVKNFNYLVLDAVRENVWQTRVWKFSRTFFAAFAAAIGKLFE